MIEMRNQVSRTVLDSASVQRYALAGLAITSMLTHWARPSERMLSDFKSLLEDHGIENPAEWARWAFRTRGVR